MISIVIPARNEEKFLSACLESLRNQNYRGEYEIIVADNGSTDETANIARSFGAKVIPCSEKKSVFYARQVGADAASGDIIVQADADTVYPGDWLKGIANQFASHPEAVAVTGRFIYRDPPYWAKLEYFLRHHTNRLTCALFGRPLVIHGATFAFRRRAFLAVNGYKDILYCPDQYGMAGRLSKLGKILYDRNLCVLTSSRSVQKPFFILIMEFLTNLNRWGVHVCKPSLSILQHFTIKTPSRRIATNLLPVLMLIILFIGAHGCFVPSSQVFGKVYYEGNSSEKVIALTFDGGPNEPYTSEILDILASYNVRATFFVFGEKVKLYPETAKRIIAEGHVLGSHSYSHDVFHTLTQLDSNDLRMAQEAIFNTAGVRPHLYRPPHGVKTPWELKNAEKLGMIVITWSVSTDELDDEMIFGEPSLEAGVKEIISEVGPGEIILLHDGYGTNHGDAESNQSLTVEALPLIIEQLQDKGYKFVTVSELLNVPAYND
ncbi:glycosyltransferase [candidate division NPL-UPA2 bacterium]|nr:glycosyltransferase [candidate division NPL-UPA2 bacterium]